MKYQKCANRINNNDIESNSSRELTTGAMFHQIYMCTKYMVLYVFAIIASIWEMPLMRVQRLFFLFFRCHCMCACTSISLIKCSNTSECARGQRQLTHTHTPPLFSRSLPTDKIKWKKSIFHWRNRMLRHILILLHMSHIISNITDVKHNVLLIIKNIESIHIYAQSTSRTSSRTSFIVQLTILIDFFLFFFGRTRV